MRYTTQIYTQIWLTYRLDANRKDYRAWYGLGQAYELLNMHAYSLQYFQRATSLRYVCTTDSTLRRAKACCQAFRLAHVAGTGTMLLQAGKASEKAQIITLC